jgi:hypothetical protein
LGVLAVFVSACSAIQLTPEGAKVEIVSTVPTNCTLLGKVKGSQGNWLTGEYTSEDNLMQGSRNDARNRAAALGANTVYLYVMDSPDSGINAGADNSTVGGEAFRCN